MDNLISLHNWVMNEQNFLSIPDTNKTLSIVPEYVFKYRDRDSKIIVSRTPVGTKLNCALQEGEDFIDYVEFYDESEFFNYIIKHSGPVFI
jgi:hypothetical protein